jgi:hypothetical protein
MLTIVDVTDATMSHWQILEVIEVIAQLSVEEFLSVLQSNFVCITLPRPAASLELCGMSAFTALCQ